MAQYRVKDKTLHKPKTTQFLNTCALSQNNNIGMCLFRARHRETYICISLTLLNWSVRSGQHTSGKASSKFVGYTLNYHLRHPWRIFVGKSQPQGLFPYMRILDNNGIRKYCSVGRRSGNCNKKTIYRTYAVRDYEYFSYYRVCLNIKLVPWLSPCAIWAANEVPCWHNPQKPEVTVFGVRHLDWS